MKTKKLIVPMALLTSCLFFSNLTYAGTNTGAIAPNGVLNPKALNYASQNQADKMVYYKLPQNLPYATSWYIEIKSSNDAIYGFTVSGISNGAPLELGYIPEGNCSITFTNLDAGAGGFECQAQWLDGSSTEQYTHGFVQTGGSVSINAVVTDDLTLIIDGGY